MASLSSTNEMVDPNRRRLQIVEILFKMLVAEAPRHLVFSSIETPVSADILF